MRKFFYGLAAFVFYFAGILFSVVGVFVCLDAFIPKSKPVEDILVAILLEFGMGLSVAIPGVVFWILGKKCDAKRRS